MKEKELIKGDLSSLNTISLVLWSISPILLIIAMVLGNSMHSDDDFIETFLFPQAGEGSAVFFWLFIICLVAGTFFFIMMRSCEITITDKRVYGKTKFGMRVDLPNDKISSVGTVFPKGISVATSSGKVVFWMLKNQEKVFDVLSGIIKERQYKGDTLKKDNFDEIKKYQELLKDGTITQEEFDKKKKELLDL